MKTETLDALAQLEHAGLANPPADLVAFFSLAANLLSDLPVKAVQDGVRTVILEEEFFPRISTLRKAAMQAARSGHSTAEQPGMKPDYARARETQYLADKNPAEWTTTDHAEYERWYGKPVWWKKEPIDTEAVPA